MLPAHEQKLQKFQNLSFDEKKNIILRIATKLAVKHAKFERIVAKIETNEISDTYLIQTYKDVLLGIERGKNKKKQKNMNSLQNGQNKLREIYAKESEEQEDVDALLCQI